MTKYISLLSIFFVLFSFAQDEQISEEDMIKQFEQSLNYQQGTITLGKNLATLEVPENFRYLDSNDTKRILEDAWGNPPGYETLGMLFPNDVSPLSPEGWGVIITYSEDGYVKDSDAEDIDYADLLKDMKEGNKEANKEREKMGYVALVLEGWAEPPHYDKENKKLYWAKELSTADDPNHTLNYAIRILGRKGVLEFNAVASMNQLDTIKPSVEEIVQIASFNQGHRYADFNPDVDKVAAYGIAGLVAGKVALKTGFLKGLIALLIAGKKFVLFGLIALGGMASKLFGRAKEEDIA